MFDLISNSKIVGFPDGNILDLCPTMDLLVLSMNKMSLWVFRLNGERIYSINNKSIIFHHSWSPTGRFFCLTGNDNMAKIYDTNNGEMVLEFQFDQPIEYLNWYGETPVVVNELFDVDILNNMPVIDKFKNFDDLDYMVVSCNSEISFVFNSLIKLSFSKSFKVLQNDNYSLFNQFYLVQDQKMGLLNLSFKSDQNMIKLINLSCKISSIFKNFHKELTHLLNELPQFYNLLDRYISNYYDNLVSSLEQEKDKNAVIKSFNKMVLTNLIPESLTDYWLNQFGERGWKRLSKLGNSMYDSVRNVTFKVLINYLEKLIILIDQMKGIIEFQKVESVNDYGFDTDTIQDLINLVNVYFKSLYKLIWDSNDEQKLFNEFMNWTKYTIDILTKHKNDEEIDISGNFKHKSLINYFQNHLFNSKLWDHFQTDLSKNDLIILAEPKVNLMANFNTLNDTFDKIFTSFELYFASQIELSDIIALDPQVGPNSKLKIINETGYIYSVTDNRRLNISVFDVNNPKDLSFHSISFDHDVVNYDMLDNKMVVLCNTANGNILQYHQITSLFNGDSAGAASTQVLLDKPGFLSLDENRSKVCVFDETKKNYSIFRVN